MKYKILKGTALFDTLLALHERIVAARAEIKKAVEELGYSEYAVSKDYLVNCGAIVIQGLKPDGWKRVGESYQSLFMPTVKNKTVGDKLAALPAISNDELNNIVGFHWHVGDNLTVYSRPAFVMRKNYALIAVGEGADYKPLADMIEITVSEYNKLSEEETTSTKRKKKVKHETH